WVPSGEPEQSGGIVDEKLLPDRGIRRIERDQIDDLALVRHDLDVGMRPVGAPQHAVRRVVDQALGKWHRVMKWLAGGGRPLQARDLYPALFIARLQIEQRLESGIVEALCRKHRS